MKIPINSIKYFLGLFLLTIVILFGSNVKAQTIELAQSQSIGEPELVATFDGAMPAEGTNGIIVVDLASGDSWRRLGKHPSSLPETNFVPRIEGQPILNRPENGEPSYMTFGTDGIALANDGSKLYYCALSGRHLYSVELDVLTDKSSTEEDVAATVEDLGEKGASDGLESDSEGRVYITDYEHNAIRRRLPQTMAGNEETLVFDDRLLWSDTLSLAQDGYLYFIVNQLHRQPGFHNGEDLRNKPYSLFRIAVNARPVSLK